MRIVAVVLVWLLAIVVALAVGVTIGVARDLGQWEGTDPSLRRWFESLRMPDRPGVSCCGDADAYYADAYEVKDGRVIATITDARGHLVPEGTQIEVPPHKVNRDANMTGHTIIFLGGNPDAPNVYCFIPSTGV